MNIYFTLYLVFILYTHRFYILPVFFFTFFFHNPAFAIALVTGSILTHASSIVFCYILCVQEVVTHLLK